MCFGVRGTKKDEGSNRRGKRMFLMVMRLHLGGYGERGEESGRDAATGVLIGHVNRDG